MTFPVEEEKLKDLAYEKERGRERIKTQAFLTHTNDP